MIINDMPLLRWCPKKFPKTFGVLLCYTPEPVWPTKEKKKNLIQSEWLAVFEVNFFPKEAINYTSFSILP